MAFNLGLPFQKAAEGAGNLLGTAKSLIPDLSLKSAGAAPSASGNILNSAVKGADNTLHNLLNTGSNILQAPGHLLKGAVTTSDQVLDTTVTGVNNTLHNLFNTGANILQTPSTIIEGVVPTGDTSDVGEIAVTGVNNTFHNIVNAGANLLQAPGQLLTGAVTTSDQVLDTTVTGVNNTLHNLLNTGANVLQTPSTILKGVVSTGDTTNVLDTAVTGVNNTFHNVLNAGANVLQAPGHLLTGAVTTSDQVLDTTVTGVNHTVHNLLNTGANVLQTPSTILNGAVSSTDSNQNIFGQAVSTIKTTANKSINTASDIITNILSPKSTTISSSRQSKITITTIDDGVTDFPDVETTESTIYESTTDIINTAINSHTSTATGSTTFSQNVVNATKNINEAVTTTIHDFITKRPVTQTTAGNSEDVTSTFTHGTGGGFRKTTEVITDVINSNDTPGNVFSGNVTSTVSTVTNKILHTTTIGDGATMQPQDQQEVVIYIVIGIVIGILILVGVASCYIYRKKRHAKTYTTYQVNQMKEFSSCSNE